MKLNQRQSISRLWGPIAMMATISLLSGTAGVQLGGFSFVGIDKLGHFVIFGLLAVAWARWLGSVGLPTWRIFLFAVGLTTAFGLFDELHQYTNPQRTFEWADLFADFVGAATGTFLYLRVGILRTILEMRTREVLGLRSFKNFPRSVR